MTFKTPTNQWLMLLAIVGSLLLGGGMSVASAQSSANQQTTHSRASAASIDSPHARQPSAAEKDSNAYDQSADITDL